MAEAAKKELKRILVTGGNSGIGFALCKQLLSQKGCYVYVGSRNLDRGNTAVEAIKKDFPDFQDNIEVVQVDISKEESIKNAAASVKQRLGDNRLYALVNNAGTGLAHKGVSAADIINVNYWGTKMMTDSFLELVQADGGRVVHVGSGAGPMWMAKQSEDVHKVLGKGSVDQATLDSFIKSKTEEIVKNSDMFGAYGLSKAGLGKLAEVEAAANSSMVISSLTPGFINTAICEGFGASKKPEEGTVSLMKCLFEDLPGNGYFYGSDGLRSPLHVGRNPGEPEYDGK